MNMHFGFTPDAARARLLDRRMHAALASSIEHLSEVSRGSVAFDESAINQLIASLRGDDCYPPMLFRDYYALTEALIEDDEAGAVKFFDRLAQSRPIPEQLSVQMLDDAAHCEKSAIYQQMMTGDSGTDIAILPPSQDVGKHFVARFQKGMELMDRILPELAGEVRALVREVVCVVGDPDRKMQFDGGSHFQLWGALFLNANFHPTDQAIVEVVAHESAHSFLFACCTDEPLVFNDDDDLYPSPLRVDPRPMDGIYHATFVSARMHWSMSRLMESDLLSDEGRVEALAARDADRKNFESGYEVISAHGDLSDTGARLMESARAYMDNATA